MEEENQIVMFDNNGAIRMYNPEKYDELVKTVETQKSYVGKMDEFRNVVNQTMQIVERLGKAIEQEKLKAIGARNVVESEEEERNRALQEAQVRLREKQMELDRYVAEYDSLKKVEQEQQQTFKHLSKSGE
ncbi:intraflagellar transport (IFT) protein [Angomonas deanei]|uniref:Intraflagellar transport complex B, subunit 20, putative n=1 Tax=Angomonas deanei TaxID=59799 RepID=S9WKM6_9TRYP|nr:intraflagellar transport (IFT) protein [Angomonas deanei]EPY39636.1 intraflagellar transport (IFT) protein [Angomonas deanei]CAD2218082.1 Intraflagellar transport complex B, subunit 20, putative [Angomonas deanei]|eukprot:EPY34041.1 intraflagellar transport (IFT) protein [Angomonas deanei]